MSDIKKDSQQAEKTMTKYDLKMQKRAEDKKKEAKSLMIWKIVGIILAAAVLGFILSFPVRNIMALKKTVVNIDGEKIGTVEFDYVYNTVKNNYIANYGSYLSYYGLTESTDPSTVMYNDKLTFKDYFEQLTVDQLKQNVALEREAKAAGFSYDATEEWNNFLENAQDAAKKANSNVADYLKSVYGKYATKARLKSVVKGAAEVSEYYESVYDSKLPTDEEIEAYYTENAADYDSVNYYLTSVSATLPTEPTELADEGAAVAEDGTYTPSDAEKEAAMAVAKEEADKAVSTVMTDGTYHENELSSDVVYSIREWLFEDGRANGDTTVIENTATSLYYVVGFDSRFRSEEPTVNIRAIVTDTDNGAEIMAEWEASDKTEEAFETLVKTYSLDSTEGGLYKNQNPETYEGEIKEWIFSADRKKGDVSSFYVGEAYTYVVYYLEQAEPVWKLSVKDAMMNTRMNEYLETIVEGMEVTGDLNYLKVEAEEAAAESTDAETTEAESNEAESTETESTETTDAESTEATETESTETENAETTGNN
ncbi:MAG: hypothetical protein K5669_07265 [Lachnospiraceae bacterium]|nr:hypothetical protein [Lachnospiraceae bacterium]